MFMNPSSFEADEIEKELADAGLEPEDARVTSPLTSVNTYDAVAHGAKQNRHEYVNPVSSVRNGDEGFAAVGDGVIEDGMAQPRAIAKDRAGSSGGRPAPSYGRHSKGGSGLRSKSRPQMVPPSSPPPGAREERTLGDDETQVSDYPSGSTSTGGGASSRARVLAQQREIQRRKRQQALSSGGIRASDAASLRRGLVLGQSAGTSKPEPRVSLDGDIASGRGGQPSDNAKDSSDHRGDAVGEEGRHSFSTAVKQFSAPRQVESDPYVAFSVDPRTAGDRSGLSEFDHRRRSSGFVDGLDEHSDENSTDGRRRRARKMVATDHGASGEQADSPTSPKKTTVDIIDQRAPTSSQAQGGSRRNLKNHDDWDDRRRPASKSYKWDEGSSDGDDDENQDHSDGGSSKKGKSSKSAWRSVGREPSPEGVTSDSSASASSGSRGSRSSSGPRRAASESVSGSSSRSNDDHDDDAGTESRDGRRRSRRHQPRQKRSALSSTVAGGVGTRPRGSSSASPRPPSSSSASYTLAKAKAGSTERSRRSKKGGRTSHNSSAIPSAASPSSSVDSVGEAHGNSSGSRRRGASSRGGARRGGSGSRYPSTSVGRAGRRRDEGDDREESVDGSSTGGRRDGHRSERTRRHHRTGAGQSEAESGRNTSFRRRHGSKSIGGNNSGNYRRNKGRRQSWTARRESSSSTSSDASRGSPHSQTSDINGDANDQRSPASPARRGSRTQDRRRRGGGLRDRIDGDTGDGGVSTRGEGRHMEPSAAAADTADSEGKHQSKSHGFEVRGAQSSKDRTSGVDEGKTAGERNDSNHREEETKMDGRVGGRDRAIREGVTEDPAAAAAGPGELVFNMDALDLSDMKRFLVSPCPRAAGVVQCYIRRNKIRANKLFPEYSLFMKEGDKFLMCSKKRPNNATSNYLVSMRAGDLDRNSQNFLGKLRANFVGTEFQVFDDGYNPREQSGTFGLTKGLGSGASGGPMREELGCVLYASNVLGSRGPRKMQVAIPMVSEDALVAKWSELDGGRGAAAGGGGSKAIERVKNRDYDGSLYMVNKPPRWNDQVGAYVLNFYGRVTMASVKNFQLVSTEDFDRIILQFGRVAKDEFTMDFQFPISPFQAFAITLSSFDSKIACD